MTVLFITHCKNAPLLEEDVTPRGGADFIYHVAKLSFRISSVVWRDSPLHTENLLSTLFCGFCAALFFLVKNRQPGLFRQLQLKNPKKGLQLMHQGQDP